MEVQVNERKWETEERKAKKNVFGHVGVRLLGWSVHLSYPENEAKREIVEE